MPSQNLIDYSTLEYSIYLTHMSMLQVNISYTNTPMQGINDLILAVHKAIKLKSLT